MNKEERIKKIETSIKESLSYFERHDKACCCDDCLSLSDTVYTIFSQMLEEYSYPDIEADGYTFCGKCGQFRKS